MTKEQIKKPKSNKLKILTAVASTLAATTAVFVGLFTWKAVTNKPSGYVKVSFDTGISHFSDGNNVKTMYVENGTKLKDIKIEWPIFDLNETFHPGGTYDPYQTRHIEYWANKVNGEMVQQDAPITKDVELVANYYSLSQLKDLCLGISLETLVRAMGQRPEDEELVNYYKEYEKDISLYESESQVVGRTMLVDYAISQWILRPSETKDNTKGAVDNINICPDKRAQSIASLYIYCWETWSGEKDKMISTLNNLYTNIVLTSARYTHWCTQVCSDSFPAIYNASDDEIKSEFISESRYFASAIDRCYKYDTAYKISEIASLYFDETSAYTDIDEIKKAFYGYDDAGEHIDGAKDYVEQLLSWEEKYE